MWYPKLGCDIFETAANHLNQFPIPLFTMWKSACGPGAYWLVLPRFDSSVGGATDALSIRVFGRCFGKYAGVSRYNNVS